MCLSLLLSLSFYLPPSIPLSLAKISSGKDEQNKKTKKKERKSNAERDNPSIRDQTRRFYGVFKIISKTFWVQENQQKRLR